MTTDDIPPGRLPADLEDAARRGDIDYLIEALRAPAFEVRVAAARGLGEAGGERANLALLSVARDRRGERPEVRIAALRSLGRIHGEGRYASILEEFIARENRKVTAAARKMLQAVDPEGFPRRLAAGGSVDHGAIRVYGNSGEESAIGLLRGFLTEREEAGDITSATVWGKVYAAARALGNIGGDDAVEILEALVSYMESEDARQTGLLARGRTEKIIGAARASLDRLGKG